MTAPSCRVAIRLLYDEDPRARTSREVIDDLDQRYPGAWTAGTIRAHLIGLCTNHSSAHHYPHLQTFAFLEQTPEGAYRPAEPAGAASRPAIKAEMIDWPISPPARRAAPRARVNRTERMAERSEDLAANFAHYLREFERRSVFGGPSVHFHVRAIERRSTHESVRAAAADTDLLELIYAMLASWGMHRMGPKGAKLVDFEPFCEGIRRQVAILEELEDLRIQDLPDAAAIADRLWSMIKDARLSASGTQVVTGTKAFHHLLPQLIPPVDREYTIRFFHESKLMTMGDEAAFKEVYPALAEIAARARERLIVNDRSPMNTSPTKILDNAIIGYVWSRLKPDTVDASTESDVA